MKSWRLSIATENKNMPIYVFDASVILNYLLDENKDVGKEIKNIFRQEKSGKTQIYSVNLLPFEVGNVLKNKLSQDNNKKIFGLFKKQHIIYKSLALDQMEEIISLSCQFDTTVYDTSYHYLAKILGGTFITCDRNYFNKAKTWGNIKLI